MIDVRRLRHHQLRIERTQKLVARFRLKIGSVTARGRRYQPRSVGRLGASRGVLRQIRTRGGRIGDDFKTASLQRHLWVRNAPYALKDPDNPLKSRQMRPPSERTRNPPLALKSLSFFPDVTRECYHSAPSRTFISALMTLRVTCRGLPHQNARPRSHQLRSRQKGANSRALRQWSPTFLQPSSHHCVEFIVSGGEPRWVERGTRFEQ
jgi:hypothetical protein